MDQSVRLRAAGAGPHHDVRGLAEEPRGVEGVRQRTGLLAEAVERAGAEFRSNLSLTLDVDAISLCFSVCNVL